MSGRGSNFNDRTGERFGMLTVLRRGTCGAPNVKGTRAVTWVCSCDCGVEREFSAKWIAKSHSCGCRRPSADARVQAMIGQRFGRLVPTALASGPNDKRGIPTRRLVCACDCGNEKVADPHQIRRGHTTSCGCLAKEVTISKNTRHGMSRSPESEVWRTMRSRCSNPKNPAYPRYGGRGIKVCVRWDDFAAFLSDMRPRPIGIDGEMLTIDRKNNDGDYEPGNCRWATMKEQNRNKSSNRIVIVAGVSMPLVAACEIVAVDQSLVRSRLRAGWTFERAISEPKRQAN